MRVGILTPTLTGTFAGRECPPSRVTREDARGPNGLEATVVVAKAKEAGIEKAPRVKVDGLGAASSVTQEGR